MPPRSRSVAGVYGRVAHLADMRDKRYRLAVTAAMGKDFDGVVVKDGACDCSVSCAACCGSVSRAACVQRGGWWRQRMFMKRSLEPL